MEKPQENNRQFIEKIITCVKEFCIHSPIVVGDVQDFLFKKRADIQDIGEVLIRFNENPSQLSLPEKEFVSMLFSKSMQDYLKIKFLDDTDAEREEYDIFVDFIHKIQALFIQTQQESIVSDVCEDIVDIIKSGEQVSKIDFVQNKWALEGEVRGKLLRVL